MRRFVFTSTVFALASTFSLAPDSQGATLPPLDTPPPERASADALSTVTPPPAEAEVEVDVSEAASAAAPVTTAALEPTTDAELESLKEGTDDTWAVDEEFEADEIDAFSESGFRDPGSVDAAEELFKTAALQIETQEYSAAERALTDGVSMIESELGNYDPALIEPLTLLGESLHGQGDYTGAIDAYERAVHVTRVNDGLHSAAQVDIIYKEADSLAALGDIERANDRHEYAYETLLREYGPNSVELVPGMYKLAHWYSQNNDIFSARGLYQYAARALSVAYGTDDTRLIPALKGIAMTYRLERFPPYRRRDDGSVSMTTGPTPIAHTAAPRSSVNRFGDGERALQQIVRIQETNPEATISDITVAILDLADWNLMFEKWERAYTLYEFCYQILSEEGEVPEEEMVAYFGQPRPLYLPLPDDPEVPGNMAVVPTEGYVELSYTVTDRGFVHDLETTASNPEGLMDFKVRRAMRSARFRPQIVGGEAVETRNLIYRHTFQYYPKLEDAEEAPGDGMARPGPDEGAEAT